MNLLILGSSKPGSMDIRGYQLGGALGARVTATPTAADWAWADRVVLVKRAKALYQTEVQQRGLPLVWDALDFWAQPLENGDGMAVATTRFQAHILGLRPVQVIGATQAQTAAAGAVGWYLPHHHWPGLTPGDVRPDLRTVGYQGHPAYLGVWADRLTRVCADHGWTFVVNPPDLRAADVLVAFRDGPWDGWACRQWKSGVKLVNAIAAGRPILTQVSAAWDEIQPPGTVVETEADLTGALEAWRDPHRRQWAADASARIEPTYRLETVAASYAAMLAAEAPVHV